MQRNLDIQILRKIFAVLCSQSDCNLTFMKCFVELKLVILATLRSLTYLLVCQKRRQGMRLLVELLKSSLVELLRLSEVVDLWC